MPGFEPGAYRLGGGRSILLSYTRRFVEDSVYQRFRVGVFGFVGHRPALDLGVVCTLCAKHSRIQASHRILEVHPPRVQIRIGRADRRMPEQLFHVMQRHAGLRPLGTSLMAQIMEVKVAGLVSRPRLWCELVCAVLPLRCLPLGLQDRRLRRRADDTPVQNAVRRRGAARRVCDDARQSLPHRCAAAGARRPCDSTSRLGSQSRTKKRYSGFVRWSPGYRSSDRGKPATSGIGQASRSSTRIPRS